MYSKLNENQCKLLKEYRDRLSITEINCTTDKRIEEIRNEYQHFVKGKIPHIKRNISTNRNPDTKAEYPATEYEITKVLSGTVLLQEFDASQFLPLKRPQVHRSRIGDRLALE
jgi:hypothetical protein